MAIVRQISECACTRCKNMCRIAPCIPDPAGAQKLIDAGYKDKLELGWYSSTLYDESFDWPCIKPIKKEDYSACIFFNDEGLCDLHDKGLKPIEGQLAIHDIKDSGLRKWICFSWVSKEGIAVMKQFEDSENAVKILTEMLKYRIKQCPEK